MNDQQQKALTFTNRFFAAAVFIGITMMCISFFVSDLIGKYVLFAGIGVLVASVFVFLFGIILSLLEGESDQRRQRQLSSSKKGAHPSH